MLFAWFRARRRRKLLSRPFPPAWMEHLKTNVWPYARLSEPEQSRLRDDLRIFVSEKYWEGCAGLTVTEEMQVTIAALACLLVLGHPDHQRHYPRVLSMLVYPSAYQAPQQRVGRDGVVHEGEEVRLGEAWYRGPVILAWDEVLAGGRRESPGRNVVLHEFAHQLDMEDRSVDGTPPLENPEQYRRWHEVMTLEYSRLVREAERGQVTLLDQYGAVSEIEFFAVATECFFERAIALQQRHPQLYRTLQMFYRQDPARWRV